MLAAPPWMRSLPPCAAWKIIPRSIAVRPADLCSTSIAIEIINGFIPFAGTGSVLTSNKTVEMDAFVMDGKTQGVGAVACVSDVKNPVLLARKVMETVRHSGRLSKEILIKSRNVL